MQVLKKVSLSTLVSRSMRVTAGARPEMNEIFSQFNPNLADPKEQKKIDAAAKKGLSYTPPVAHGTFWDLFVNPSMTGNPVASNMNKLQEATEKFRRYLKASKEGTRSGSKLKSIPDLSLLYFFNEMFMDALFSIFDEAVSADRRNKVVKEKEVKSKSGAVHDFEEPEDKQPSDSELETSFHTYLEAARQEFKSSFEAFENCPIVSKVGDDWRVTLPVGHINFDKFFSSTVNGNARDVYSEVLYKIKERLNINFLQPGEVDTVIPFNTIKSLASEIKPLPSMKSFMGRYVVGFRVKGASISATNTSYIESVIKRYTPEDTEDTGHPDIINERTGTRAPLNTGNTKIVNERAGLYKKKVLANDSDFDDDDTSDNNSNNSVTRTPVDVPVEALVPDWSDAREAFDANPNICNFVLRPIIGYIVLTLPATEAEFYTQTSASDIKASYLLEHFRTMFQNNLLPLIPYHTPMERIEEINAGYPPAPKCNGDGLCVDENNAMYYIPTVNNIKLYEATNEACVDTGTGEFTFNNAQKSWPANVLIYTDWVNNKFTYTDSKGRIHVLDTERFYPATETSLLGALGSSISDLVTSSGGDVRIGSVFSVLSNVYKAYANVDCVSYISKKTSGGSRSLGDDVTPDERREIDYIWSRFNMTRMSPESNLAEIISFFSSLYTTYLVRNNEMTDKDQATFNSKTSVMDFLSNKFCEPILDYISEAAVSLHTNLTEALRAYSSNATSPISILAALGFAMVFFKYRTLEARQALRSADKDRRRVYWGTDTKKTSENYNPEFHNISSERVLKSYQNRALSNLDKDPPSSILAVDAGGGKTAMVILNVMQMLQKGVVKKPWVLCPAHLVKDYVAEINFFYSGKVNALVLTNHVLQNYGKQQILNLVKNAPINTIFISDYNVFRLRPTRKPYNNSSMESYGYSDMFRACNFDGVWCDESHYLKNRTSQTSQACRFAISEIPFKRLCSGTLTPNKLKDLVTQFAFFDPTVFGNVNQFENYLDSLKTDVERGDYIRRILKNNCMYIEVGRREWAHELPTRHVGFYKAHLTENQMKAYQAVLDVIVSSMDTNKKITGDGASIDTTDKDDSEDAVPDVEEESSADTGGVADFMSRFQTQLCDLEMFTAAPASHQKSAEFLVNKEDFVSPKGLVINKVIKDHLAKNIPGKILVFTNWELSVRAIFDALDDNIKSQVLIYDAAMKHAHLRKFQNDSKYQIMLGIGSSMSTGLNLQFCSRLILSECFWGPGNFEQAQARIFRPVKLQKDDKGNWVKDPRKNVYIDSIVVDRSFDVLKTSALIYKSVTVCKTFNGDNPIYKDIPSVEPVKLTSKNIRETLQFDNLTPYFEANFSMLDAQHTDYDTFASEHPEVKILHPVTDLGNLEGSKLLSRIPYTPGMTLLDAEALGLVPFLAWRAVWRNAHGGNFITDDFPSELVIHTELGEGIFYSFGSQRIGQTIEGDTVEVEKETVEGDKARVKVRFRKDLSSFDPDVLQADPDFADRIVKDDRGSLVSFEPTTVFVVTKTENTPGDIRRSTLNALGMPIQESDIKFITLHSKDEKADVRIAKQIEAAKRKSEKQRKKDEQEAKDIQKKSEDIRKSLTKGKDVIPTTPNDETVKKVKRDKDIVDGKKPTKTSGTKVDKNIKPKPTVNDVKDVIPQDKENRLSADKIRVYIATVNNMLGLMISSNDSKVAPAALKPFGFVAVDPYIHARVSTMKNFETLLDRIIPQFDDGTRITTKTPIVTNIKEFVKQGKYYVSKKTGLKIPASMFEEGNYVESAEELPLFDVTDDAYESMESLYNEFRQIMSGTIVVENSPRTRLLNFEKLSRKHLTQGTLQPYLTVLDRVLHICVDLKISNSKDVTAIKSVTSDIPKMKWILEQQDMRRLCTTKAELVQVIKDLRTEFEIVNFEDLREEVHKIKARGRPSNI